MNSIRAFVLLWFALSGFIWFLSPSSAFTWPFALFACGIFLLLALVSYFLTRKIKHKLDTGWQKFAYRCLNICIILSIAAALVPIVKTATGAA